MATKKKYDPSKLNTDPLYGMLAGAGQDEPQKEANAYQTQVVQDTPIEGETPKEQKARLKKSVADGLKRYRGNKDGERLDRIGMAFLPEIYDYIRVMSKAEGMTLTGYVNMLVAIEMERNGERYKAVKAALDEE